MESSTLKLIIEKGPREGESLEYKSGFVVKIGRLVRGNTIAIKDAGISSKHISIQFDNETSKWNLTDLDSSNGTIVNGNQLEPNLPSPLDDGDCIKIGELTSIIVKIEVQPTIPVRRNTRRQGKTGAPAVVEKNPSELGFDCDLGEKENAVEEPVQKRNLRPRGKKVVDSNTDVTEIPVPVERKTTRGRSKKLPEDPDLDTSKPADKVDGRNTRRGRKRSPVEPLEEPEIDESVRVEAAGDVAENSGLKEDLNTNTESAQKDVAEKLSTKERCEGEEVDVDKETGVDTSRWQDLEKMTLGDFFDYLEWDIPREIREKTEEIIAHLPEIVMKYHKVKVQHENGKGKQAMD